MWAWLLRVVRSGSVPATAVSLADGLVFVFFRRARHIAMWVRANTLLARMLLLLSLSTHVTACSSIDRNF